MISLPSPVGFTLCDIIHCTNHYCPGYYIRGHSSWFYLMSRVRIFFLFCNYLYRPTECSLSKPVNCKHDGKWQVF